MDENTHNPDRHHLYDEVATTIQWAASELQTHLGKLAKDAGLSLPQFSVLRILHQANDALSCSEIAERMIARDPDITRLIDKLQKSGMVSRQRSEQDRRVVRSAITPIGAEVVQRVGTGVNQLHLSVFSPLDDEHLQVMRDRLRRLRLG